MIEVVCALPAPLDTLYEWRTGDTVAAIGGTEVGDILDVYFWASEEETTVLEIRRADGQSVEIDFPTEAIPALTECFAPLEFRRCACKCIFCFVDQNPCGMREPIYVKDEDYRFSFLYGNYVTLTSLGAAGMRRVIEQGMSPLFVSVHATDVEARTRMLGIKKRIDIMDLLRRLGEGGITMHTQIVLCPGHNDGDILDRSIEDLLGLAPAVASLAVVPVGLTGHRESLAQLTPVTPDIAREVIARVDRWRAEARNLTGENFVHLSDEFYLLADAPFPEEEAYGDFPQIDNGIGLSVDLREAWHADLADSKTAGELPHRDITLLTGMIGARAFERDIVPELVAAGGDELPTISILPVENRFYGPSVTVAGLLSGADVRRAVTELDAEPGRCILLPPRMFNSDALTLDDMHLEEVAEGLPHRLFVGVEEGFIDFWKAIG